MSNLLMILSRVKSIIKLYTQGVSKKFLFFTNKDLHLLRQNHIYYPKYLVKNKN